MKKIAALLLLTITMTAVSYGQFTAYGFQIGGGYSRIADNLITKGGTFGATIGAYTNLEFNSAKTWAAQHLYLQFGLNFMRRGGGMYEEYSAMEGRYTSTHECTFSTYYAQIPILLNFRYELMSQTSHQNVRLFLGPAFSFGIFGFYDESMITPRIPNEKYNYKIEKAPAFNYLNRIDANVIFGIGYQYNEFFASIYLDYGFLSLKDETDILRKKQRTDSKIAGGNNMSYMLTIGYELPIYR